MLSYNRRMLSHNRQTLSHNRRMPTACNSRIGYCVVWSALTHAPFNSIDRDSDRNVILSSFICRYVVQSCDFLDKLVLGRKNNDGVTTLTSTCTFNFKSNYAHMHTYHDCHEFHLDEVGWVAVFAAGGCTIGCRPWSVCNMMAIRLTYIRQHRHKNWRKTCKLLARLHAISYCH